VCVCVCVRARACTCVQREDRKEGFYHFPSAASDVAPTTCPQWCQYCNGSQREVAGHAFQDKVDGVLPAWMSVDRILSERIDASEPLVTSVRHSPLPVPFPPDSISKPLIHLPCHLTPPHACHSICPVRFSPASRPSLNLLFLSLCSLSRPTFKTYVPSQLAGWVFTNIRAAVR
jgi:hypothetical protein